MPTAAPSAPPSAMSKGSLKSRFSFGRSASLSLSKASIFSFKSVPAPAPAPQQPTAHEPVAVKVNVPPPRASEDVLAVNRKPSIVLDSPQNSPPTPAPPPRTPSGSLSRRPSSRVSFDRARPSLDLAHLHAPARTSPSPSPSPSSYRRASASPGSSAFDLSSLQFSRDEIPVPVGDSSAETRLTSSSSSAQGDQSFDIDALDPDLALLLHPGPGPATTSTPARTRRQAPPVTRSSFFDTARDVSPVPSIDEFGVRRRSSTRSDAASRSRSNSTANGPSTLRSPLHLQPAISISRPGTAPPEQQHASSTARRRDLRRSTSVEDVLAADLPMRASLDYAPSYTPLARPSFDRRPSFDLEGSTGRPSIDTVRASRRAALERSSTTGPAERNVFSSSLRARRGEQEPYWERDERTWRPAEFGAGAATQSEYGGTRSEFSGGARSEYGVTRSETNYRDATARSEFSGTRSEFGGARSASEYAGPTSAWRPRTSTSPLSPSPTPTRSVVSSVTAATSTYFADELERVRGKHAAETEALLAALGDAQRSARVLREENERLRTRVRELEERERERAEEARRAAAMRERKPALVPRRTRPGGGAGHARVVSGATTVRASPTPSPTPSPGPVARFVRSQTAPQLAYDADDSFNDAAIAPLQTKYTRSRTAPQLPPVSYADSSFEHSLDLDDADALDAQIRLPPLHRRGPSDASASSFAMSLPPEGQSLLRDKMALPDTDAEPDSDVPLMRQRSHAVLDDFDSSFDDGHLLDGLEASPTLVLRKEHKVNRSLTETERSASPPASLKLRPEHEALLGMGFESEADA